MSSFLRRLDHTILSRVMAGIMVGALGAMGVAHAAPVPAGAAMDKAAIEQIVHDYIIAHPEVLSEAAEQGRQRALHKALADNRDALAKPYAGKAYDGAKDGTKTIVEFMDYNCHYCRESVADLDRIVKEDPTVRIVYREIPILSKLSVQAARVALLVAEKTDNFSRFHHQLYAAPLTEEALIAAAKAAGIAEAEARQAMDDTSRDKEFEQNAAIAQALGATGTPIFVVGDDMFNAAVGHDVLVRSLSANKTR